ncbi:RNA polymerase sigma factor SigJ [Microbispora sp. ATCC PTA-5024]|uniref:RNA polymerase sigma factor SigJ n=1 Tax=Microbispora sp. ATCC PTA-5024 TaxID=316330 RepID=UPI0003DD1B19|nr:RNA polymerase sigma factor SigJ [Microbispora sp. ATCC PTA-5024]ETK32147.1 siderophore-interacting protein [Microbispora sp. ATCC PTA-5024]
MNDHDDGTGGLSAEFHALRPRLVGVAYGLLGSVDEAEDVVQDAWLRLRAATAGRAGGSGGESEGESGGEGAEEIRDVAAWLVVTVSRLALDVLRSARHRREEYVGPWLPEPVLGPPAGSDPADRVTLDESMSMAMLVVLESLSPAERTAFVLHDVFGLTFAEVGEAVGRSPAACRQLAARARSHVASRAPRFDVDPSEHRRVVRAFARACGGDDMDALLALLDPDVVFRSDGGGVVGAARNPVLGADKVARLLLGVRRFGETRMIPAVVNGWPGLLRIRDGRLDAVIGMAVSGGRITEVDMVMNPDKLIRVRRVTGLAEGDTRKAR